MTRVKSKNIEKLEEVVSRVLEELLEEEYFPVIIETLKKYTDRKITEAVKNSDFSNRTVRDSQAEKKSLRSKMESLLEVDNHASASPAKTGIGSVTDHESGRELAIPENLQNVFTRDYSNMFKKK